MVHGSKRLLTNAVLASLRAPMAWVIGSLLLNRAVLIGFGCWDSGSLWHVCSLYVETWRVSADKQSMDLVVHHLLPSLQSVVFEFCSCPCFSELLPLVDLWSSSVINLRILLLPVTCSLPLLVLLPLLLLLRPLLLLTGHCSCCCCCCCC